MTTKKVKKEIGKVLEQRRIELGLSMNKARKQLGQSNVGRIIDMETGRSNYKIESLIDYMRVLKFESEFIEAMNIKARNESINK